MLQKWKQQEIIIIKIIIKEQNRKTRTRKEEGGPTKDKG
jgi:hypothetical protein